MILLRHLGSRLLGWIGLALLLLLGVAALAGAVEAARFGVGASLRLALVEAPVVTLPLAPLACALGAGVAAARLVALGEADALAAMGVSSGRLAMIPLGLGLLLGGLLAQAQDHLAPRAAESALALRADLGALPPTSDWLWTGQAVVRIDDGLAVSAQDGVLVGPLAGPRPGPTEARLARALASPALASGAELAASDARPLVVERAQRLARPLACGLLAALAWLGPGWRRRRRVGPALGLALCFQALVLALSAQAAQGSIGASLAAGLPVGLLLALLALRLGPEWARPPTAR